MNTTTISIPTKNALSRIAFCLVMALLYCTRAIGQCSPDTEPPSALCKSGLQIVTTGGFATPVFALTLDLGSTDNCSPAAALQFRIEQGATPGSQPPSTTVLWFSHAGVYPVVLWVTDLAGNSSACPTTIELLCADGDPVACTSSLSVSLNEDNIFDIEPTHVLEGDYCTAGWTYRLDLQPLDGNFTPTVRVDSTHFGQLLDIQVASYEDGNPVPVSVCSTKVEVSKACWYCSNDHCKPFAFAKDSVVVDFAGGGSGVLEATAIDNGSFDYCSPVSLSIFRSNAVYQMLSAPAPSITFLPADIGVQIVGLVATDANGNSNTVYKQITVQDGAPPPCPDFGLHLPADFYPGDAALDSVRVTGTNFFEVSAVDEIINIPCTHTANRYVRTWTIRNLCALDTTFSEHVLSRLDINGDGLAGDAFDAVSVGDSLYVPSFGTAAVTNLGGGVFKYEQQVRLNYADTLQRTVSGRLFHDANQNCTYDAGESPLKGWFVAVYWQFSNTIARFETDSQGIYTATLCPFDTYVRLSADVPYNIALGTNCPTLFEFYPDVAPISQAFQQDIGVQLDDACPVMVVDMASPRIRPCFDGYYSVRYANISTQTIPDVSVEIELDDYLFFTGSSIPEIDLGAGKYRFDIGELEPGQAGNFSLNFFTSCQAPNGATHCSEAHIFPDTLCAGSSLWSGANIEVKGVCVADSIHFSIKNTGAAPSQLLEFVIVEDVIMRETGTFSLTPGAEFQLSPIYADGSTFRLEAQQEPLHPFGGMPSTAVEGCNGFTQGMVMQFPTGNANPFIETVCQENISAFDPNEKTASPRGYGSQHFIHPETEIDYTIYFQNTGTDTAYRVVVVDSLSPFLDASRALPLASSHPFRFEKNEGNGVLRFVFEDIRLPDSSVNYPASQGFIKFHIPQAAVNLPGTVITNRSAIYFDFNDPILTNTVFHTVDSLFIEVSAVQAPGPASGLTIYPNPGRDMIWFDLPLNASVEPLSGLQFTVTDPAGKVVANQTFEQFPFRWERRDLPAGIYVFAITDQHLGLLFSGTIALR